jgi:ABC-type transport system substrate-binding protein
MRNAGRPRWPRGDTPPGRRVLVVVSGLAVATAYLLGAFLTGRLDPLARRPILDGFAPPPPYQWVSPPPSEASGNHKPTGASSRVKFGANGASKAGVVSTSDLQATLILSAGSFPPATGQAEALVTIEPLAPGGLGEPPAGLAVDGNVYRYRARYQPSGDAVPELAKKAQLTLAYPPSADGLVHRHAILQSEDGKTWTTLVANDAGQQAGVEVTSLGYFAVAEYVTGGKRPFPVGKILQYVLIAALVIVLAIPIVAHELRSRRARKRRAARRSRRR